MPTPSLLIVPARFKTGKLYSQIPTSGAGDFTVTRNTAARRFGPDGLIASVASGIPRLDYYTSGGTAGCPALLVEPAATNLVKYSEQFNTTTSGWVAFNLLTVTGNTNATLDPAGGNTADLIVGTSGTNEKQLTVNANNLPSIASGTILTWSVFAKATSAASGFVQLTMGGNSFSPSNPYANFRLTGNGAITTGIYSGASIQPFGNGWYRCSMTATTAASGTNYGVAIVPILASGTTRTGSFAGNGVDGVYIWGAQLETGSVATSYIPTTTGTGSRSADAISVANASGFIGQTEGTIYFEYYHNTATNAGIRNAFNLEGNVGSQFNGINFATSNNGNDLQVAVQVSGSSVVSGGVFSTSVSEGWHKVAFGYNTAATGTVFYFDGNLIATRTLTSIPAMSRIALMARANPFSGFDLDRQFNNRIRAAALYTTRLTNAELATLTTP